MTAEDYDPSIDLECRYPKMKALKYKLQPVVTTMTEELDSAEQEGLDVWCARQAVAELDWRRKHTSDVDATRDQYRRTKALVEQPHPRRTWTTPPQASDGSYADCTQLWWLKLEFSVDIITQNGWSGQLPTFLNPINDPGALTECLSCLRCSNIDRHGVDNGYALNAVISGLLKLILKDTPANYPYAPGLKMALSSFLAEWQDPTTGFFGAWYCVDGNIVKKAGLSPTFHVASYTNGMISYWPFIVTTLLQIRNNKYPYGWLEDGKMVHHHNMDVVRLLRLGWPWMDAKQRKEARGAIQEMLAWCLDKISTTDGTIDRSEGWSADDTAAANYAYVAAFLHHADYFKGKAPFWDRKAEFPEMEDVRLRLLRAIMTELDPYDPNTRGALDSLGVFNS